MKKVNVSPERRVRWDQEVVEMDQEVVEMLKCGYLEQTSKAERARGPFSLLIVFMVLDPSSLMHGMVCFVPVHTSV